MRAPTLASLIFMCACIVFNNFPISINQSRSNAVRCFCNSKHSLRVLDGVIACCYCVPRACELRDSQAMIDEFDRDQDGEINETEFMYIMRQTSVD